MREAKSTGRRGLIGAQPRIWPGGTVNPTTKPNRAKSEEAAEVAAGRGGEI
jgi:hypothetical protein